MFTSYFSEDGDQVLGGLDVVALVMLGVYIYMEGVKILSNDSATLNRSTTCSHLFVVFNFGFISSHMEFSD